MNYIIYTDASCLPQENLFASAYFIRTEDKFVTLGAKPFKGKSISIAETMAIGLAVDTVIEELNPCKDDKVIIFTDRMDCIDFYSNVCDEDGFPKTIEKRAMWAWHRYKELSQMCSLSLEKIRGHREDNNGNKIADRLARYSVRMSYMAK